MTNEVAGSEAARRGSEGVFDVPVLEGAQLLAPAKPEHVHGKDAVSRALVQSQAAEGGIARPQRDEQRVNMIHCRMISPSRWAGVDRPEHGIHIAFPNLSSNPFRKVADPTFARSI